MNDILPTQITERLEAILRRVRRIQFLRGMLGVLTLTLSAVLIIIAADYLFAPLSTTARWALFIGLITVIGTSFWLLFLKPLSRNIELLQIARWLEVRHPEMQERISTALELAGQSGANVSASLIEELIAEAEIDAQSLNPVVEVRSRKARVWLLPALSLVALFSLLFTLWPDQFGRLLVRAVAPFSQVGNAGAVAFDIDPGNLEILEDESIQIHILYQGSDNDVLTLETTNEQGDSIKERLQFSGEKEGKKIALYQLTNARESFSYKARAGKNESDTYKVTVWPKPRFTRLEATYAFPSYTGWSPGKHELGSNGIKALTGTTVRIKGIPNTPVESGTFMINDQEISAVDIESSATGGLVSIEFPITDKLSGVGKIILKHRLGQEIEAARFPIQALLDESPVVNLLTPVKRELQVKPTDQLHISYQVIEKIGLQAAELDLKINGQTVSPLPQMLPLKSEQSNKPLWEGELQVFIGAIIDQHPKAHTIQLKVRIKDNRPADLGGPNIGESETITLKINRSAESLVRQELRAQESDIRETANEAAKEIREAIAKMEANRANLKKEEPPKQAKEQLEEAREQLAKAEEALEELAERMEQGVHATKAEKAEKAAEAAKEAREHLETAPLNDTPEAREEELNEAQEAAEKALKEIEEMRKAIEEDRQKVEDIAKLNDLAQKEEELARQAENKAEQAATSKDSDEPTDKQQQNAEKRAEEQWQRQQKEIQEELRKEVNERPTAKAEAAREQAEQARELAEEARELSEQQEQLEDLAREANAQTKQQDQGQNDQNEDDQQQNKQQADAQEQLENAIREQLGQAQEELLEEAGEQLKKAQQQGEERADQLPEAIDEAKEALDQIRNEDTEKAAEAAHEAAETLKELSKPEAQQNEQGDDGEEPGEDNQGEPEQGEQSGENEAEAEGEIEPGDAADPELGELAEQQEMIAEALDALAEGNTKEALEALQELQAKAAEALADEIQGIPEIDGKSADRAQAEQAAQRAGDHAQEAANQTEQGNQEAAADRNAHAAKELGKAAEALEAEAKNLEAMAAQAENQAQQQGQQAQQNQAPVDDQQLAEAFAQAAEAAQADSPAAAAQEARKAAEALSELAEQAMENMQSGQQPGQQGQRPQQQGQQGQQQGQEPQQPGEGQPQEGPRPATPDPGVPPELAKLGVSLSDWEKLKEMMRSDVGGGGTSGIPDDYRNLVRKYFEEVAREGKEKP